jgi:Family of unknown function (DUF6893)
MLRLGLAVLSLAAAAALIASATDIRRYLRMRRM